MLRSLYLNHNRIIIIEPLANLKALKQLGLFHNEIIDGKDTIRIFKGLPKLKELSTDINPCSADVSFNYELILSLERLKMFNDEAVREMDKDVARQYFRIKGLPVPDEPKLASALHKSDTDLKSEDKENAHTDKTTKKSVRFKVPAEGEDSESQNVEIKRL